MKQPQSDINDTIEARWREYVHGLEEAVIQLEKDIEDASQMTDKCTSEWCTATEHVIDELSNALFSIHEPRFASDDDSKKIKVLKKKIHDLYAKYKSVAA